MDFKTAVSLASPRVFLLWIGTFSWSGRKVALLHNIPLLHNAIKPSLLFDNETHFSNQDSWDFFVPCQTRKVGHHVDRKVVVKKMGNSHAVLSQGSGFVRANYTAASQCFYGLYVFNHAVTFLHSLRCEREARCESHQHPFGYVCHYDGNEELECLRNCGKLLLLPKSWNTFLIIANRSR